MKKIKVSIAWEEKNYSAVCEDKDINGIVVVTDKNIDNLKDSVKESLSLHIQGCIEDGDDLPQYLVDGNYELEFDFLISALLHKYDKILTRSALSRVTGINEKQLGHYMSGYRKPRPDKREQILAGIRSIGRELASV